MGKVTINRVSPRHLSGEAAKLWRSLQRHYQIDDPAKLILLTAAMECYDEMRTAKRLLRRDGPTISNRFGDVKANPAVSGERSARQGMVSTLRQMNIDLKAVERPPVAMRRAKVEEEKSNVASLELVRSIIRGNR